VVDERGRGPVGERGRRSRGEELSMNGAGGIEVKICGLCRAEDARIAAEAGASYIGVILAPGRGRSQTLAQAGVIFDAPARSGGSSAAGTATRRADAAAPGRVGVFVDPLLDVVVDAARELRLDAVQLHGDEPVELVRRVRSAVTSEVWKALRVRSAADVPRALHVYATDVDALLLDGWSPHAHGGAGAQFDWSAVARSGVVGGEGGVRTGDAIADSPRLIVAGGLTPENVADAVALLRPSAVDVSSGVEAAPGRKSPEKIHAFIAAARGVRMSR
jgi:phosphoribosylanthranilate isomerase